MAEPDKSTPDLTEKVKENVGEVPRKSGLAGTLLLTIIIIGIIGIIILGLLLMSAKR